MNTHPVIGIKSIFLDLNTFQFEIRYLDSILTSSKQVPDTGTVVPKIFHQNISKSQANHDIIKPHSKVHSLKSIDSNEMENNINYKNNYVVSDLKEMSDFHSLKSVYRYLYSLIGEDNVIVSSDPISGKKYAFICSGGNMDAINSTLSKNKDLFFDKNVLTSNGKITLDVKKVPLLLKMLGENKLYSLKVAIQNHSYQDDILSSDNQIITDNVNKKILKETSINDLYNDD